MLSPSSTIAVVGASRKREKWGNIIFRLLRSYGFKVYPVNPNASEIDGIKCYSSLSDLPEKPELVITVVKPQITEKLVEECVRLGIRRIWMQPGSESEEAIEKAEKSEIEVISGSCIVEDYLLRKFGLSYLYLANWVKDFIERRWEGYGLRDMVINVCVELLELLRADPREKCFEASDVLHVCAYTLWLLGLRHEFRIKPRKQDPIELVESLLRLVNWGEPEDKEKLKNLILKAMQHACEFVKVKCIEEKRQRDEKRY